MVGSGGAVVVGLPRPYQVEGDLIRIGVGRAG